MKTITPVKQIMTFALYFIAGTTQAEEAVIESFNNAGSLTFNQVSNASIYKIESSSNLTNWSVTATNGLPVIVDVPTTEESMYYRIEVTPLLISIPVVTVGDESN